MKLNEKISKLRKNKKMSQEQLADTLNISRQAVSKWESGTSYPEMDKLLEMCKIFNCTLEELTNEERNIDTAKKNKNPLQDIVNEAIEFINKSISMFTNIGMKDVIKILIVMFLVSITLGLFQIPFKYIDDLGRNIFMNFGEGFGRFISSIWHFIISVIYIVGSITLFIMIYKRRYLDNYEITKKEKKVLEVNTIDTEEKNNTTVIYDKSWSLVKSISWLIMLFVKIVVVGMLIPFIMSIVGCAIALAISIYLLFNGLFYIGIPIMCISGLLILGELVEIVVNFVFDKRSKPKKIFINILIGLILFGIGFGITLINISKIEILDKVPTTYKSDKLIQLIDYNDNLILNLNHYHNNIEYIVDNSLSDKIKIEISYYKDFNIPRIVTNNNHIEVFSTDDEFSMKIINDFIDNLKKDRIYSYDGLTSYKIKIYTSESNLNKLKDNSQKYYNEKLDEDELINSLYSQIDELEERIDTLEENDSCEEKIQEYKDKLNDLIND